MANELIRACKANYPLFSNANTQDTLKLWLLHFANVDDGLMKTAIILCQETSKGFPTVAEIKNAINEIQRDARLQPKKQLPARSRWTSPAAKQAFEVVKTDCVKNFAQTMDISDVMDFAKWAFNDISEDTVRRNYSEILAAKNSCEMCKTCMWSATECSLNGFKVSMRMNSHGYVINEMIACQKMKAS